MNKTPCTSQNTEAKTLPADVCIFGHFRRLSPAAVHSADCQFDSRVKWWIHVSSIVTYLCKNSFVLRWKLQTTLWIVNVMLLLINCKQMLHPLWTQLSHWQMFMQNGEYTAFWYRQLFCYLTQLQFMISQNEFVEFFGVFWDNCQIWVTWSFSIICVCTTTFKVSIVLLNCCFIITSRNQHGYPWVSLATPPYHPLLLAGLQGYILYRYRAAVCRF